MVIRSENNCLVGVSMKIYIDESGNSGDLVQRKIDLTFSNQNIFTLSAVKKP